jgi:ABC-type bacteriocin/lantibiotic exporter with double-glycine peptidase domain
MLKEFSKPFRYKKIPIQTDQEGTDRRTGSEPQSTGSNLRRKASLSGATTVSPQNIGNNMRRGTPLKQQTTPGSRKPQAQDFVGTLRRISGYLAAHKWLLITVFLLIIVSSALALLGPFLVGVAIDEYIISQDTGNLLLLLSGLALVYILHSVSLWLQNWWMIGISQSTVYKMRSQFFNQLHQLPISFFDKRRHGELMSRVTNDIDNVSSSLNQSVIQIFSIRKHPKASEY